MVKRLPLFVLLVGLSTSPAQAAVIELNGCGSLLSILAEARTCQVGDKVFGNFGFQTTAEDPVAVAAGIEVVGITDDALGSNYGIRLRGPGGAPVVAAGSSLAMLIAYSVSVIDALALPITDLHLGLNSTGAVLANVEEAAFDAGGQVAFLQACLTPDPALCASVGLSNQSSATFGATSALLVLKQVNVVTVDGELNSIDQIVTQAAPEPGSLILLGVGAVGLALRRRANPRR